jgi:hypothetical protein
MPSTLEHDLIEYLWDEADRVRVHSTLPEIEAGLTLVPFDARPVRSNRMLPLVAAAASVLVVAAMVVARDEPRELPVSTAAPGDMTEPSIVTPATTAPTTTAAPTTTLATVPLPAGAVLNGIAPTCTTVDSIVYDCTIPALPEDSQIDMTGYTSVIVDDTSRVSGGCRSVSADGLHYTCYVGRRAIDEQIVAESYFGEWAPREYVAG